ncbi:MAG: uracil-DNA glycosylase family protein [Prevotella sp.]|nr:uracil-DNA glycosylase family protein [Prevotella sp.]
MRRNDNIARSRNGVEYHPLKPFLPANACVLFLGSFPPQRKRWCMDFNYPNFINDHWRLEGEVFFGDRNHFVCPDRKSFDLQAIISFCNEKGIAFYDTATAIRRLKDNASDKFLEVVEPTDIRKLLHHLPHCKAIVTTGQKATDTLCQYFGMDESPKTDCYTAIPDTYNAMSEQILLYRLPSSSRAYPLSFEKKASAYRRMFSLMGMV